MERGGWIEKIRKLVRETTGEVVFKYDPTFSQHESTGTDGEKVTATWKHNPDGSITIGREQVLSAITSAQAFQEKLGREGAERTATVIGLSVEYIKKHFPEALQGTGYDE